MKRAFAMLLTTALLLSLCACGPTEEEQEFLDLYEKYEDVIDHLEEERYLEVIRQMAGHLEEEEYYTVIQEMAQLANAGSEDEQEKTPIGQLFLGQWYWAEGEDPETAPRQFTVEANGTVMVEDTAYTWLEQNSHDTSISGYLLKDGVHTYQLRINKSKDDQVAYVQLHTVKNEDGNFYSDQWVGTYYSHPMLCYLLKSWSNLDRNDQVMDSSFGFNTSNTRINDEQMTWSVASEGEDTLTVDVDGAYTFTVELRSGLPFGTLCNTATGDQAFYYVDYSEFGPDRSWPEYIYPRAMQYLQECQKDEANGYTVYFYDAIPDGDHSTEYRGNAAWQRLYELFTGLGDYRDSAELAARFTILEDKYVGAEVLRVDQMGNESKNDSYEVVRYNAQGQVTSSKVEENFRLYGMTSYEMHFTYEENGRISKIQYLSGNTVQAIVTPVYDDQGRLVGGTYKSNNYTGELSYVYDDQGRLTENFVWSGDNRYQYTYTYDDQGRLANYECQQGWGNPIRVYYRSTTTLTYDGQGRLVEKTTTKENSGTTTFAYTYDDQGKLVSAALTETNSKGNSSYASQTVTYLYQDLYFFD